MHYYEVAPNRIVRAGSETLTYSSEEHFSVGQIVEIEIGAQKSVGVIIKQVQKPPYDTKAIIRAIESAPLPKPLIETSLWMSSYYATPLATVLQTILPSGITKNRRALSSKKELSPRNRTHFLLNKDQSAAVNAVNEMSSGTALIHGVTGSGKTRVYIELAKESIRAGKSVIVLVPEIALTSQLVGEFQHEFENILVSHSHQTEAERHQIWRQALAADYPQVVIGPRSALFLPLASVGLIVIDECHEPSYKQEQSPRYSALTTARILSESHGAKLVLGSATPLVTDYYLAKKAKRPIISMPTPAHPDRKPPVVTLVDMTKRGNFTRHRFFSDQLLGGLDATLAAGSQALIFHNRRGTTSTTLCENCGWQAGCPRCFVPLTLHADRHQLVCHICNTSMAVPTSCPECGSADIIHKGIGTKLIESELQKIYPAKRIVRFDGDSDTTQTVEKLYGDLYSGAIDIIIGTQVVAKGLDLPHLRTVGVVQADAGLALPDYTAPERTFQLLAQVIGRVGRSEHETNVVVQSYQPNHPAVVDGITQNYAEFYQRTLALREHTHFPPFSFLLKLVCIYKTEATAVRNARAFAAQIRAHNKALDVLGPTPAFYERVRDTYRWQIVVRSKKRADLLEIAQMLPPKNWQFELDPISLL